VIIPNAQKVGEQIWAELAARKSSLTWCVEEDFSISRNTGVADALYSETITPPCALWIAGSGHVAQAVAPLALQLDFAVTVFDDRPTLANRQCFPEGTCFRVDYWEKLLREPLSARPTFGLTVTRGHQHDAPVRR